MHDAMQVAILQTGHNGLHIGIERLRTVGDDVKDRHGVVVFAQGAVSSRKALPKAASEGVMPVLQSFVPSFITTMSGL